MRQILHTRSHLEKVLSFETYFKAPLHVSNYETEETDSLKNQNRVSFQVLSTVPGMVPVQYGTGTMER